MHASLPTISVKTGRQRIYSMPGMWLHQRCCRYRIDRGQEIGDQFPTIATIIAGEKLTGIGPHVNTAGINGIRTHAMAQHAQLHTRPGWQAISQRLPLLSPVLCAVYSKMLIYVHAAHRIFDDHEDGV